MLKQQPARGEGCGPRTAACMRGVGLEAAEEYAMAAECKRRRLNEQGFARPSTDRDDRARLLSIIQAIQLMAPDASVSAHLAESTPQHLWDWAIAACRRVERQGA